MKVGWPCLLLLPCALAAPQLPYDDLSTYPAYAFQYGVNDAVTGVEFGQQETRDGEVLAGSYTVALPDGRTQVVTYHDNGDGVTAEVAYTGVAHYDEAVPVGGLVHASPLVHRAPLVHAAPLVHRAPLVHPVVHAASPVVVGPLLRTAASVGHVHRGQVRIQPRPVAADSEEEREGRLAVEEVKLPEPEELPELRIIEESVEVLEEERKQEEKVQFEDRMLNMIKAIQEKKRRQEAEKATVTVKPTTSRPTTVQPTTVKPTTSRPKTVQPATVQEEEEEEVPEEERKQEEKVQFEDRMLNMIKAIQEKRRRQEAEKATVTVKPTTSRPTTVQPTTVKPTTVQPTTVQPTTVQPTTVKPIIEKDIPETARKQEEAAKFEDKMQKIIKAISEKKKERAAIEAARATVKQTTEKPAEVKEKVVKVENPKKKATQIVRKAKEIVEEVEVAEDPANYYRIYRFYR